MRPRDAEGARAPASETASQLVSNRLLVSALLAAAAAADVTSTTTSPTTAHTKSPPSHSSRIHTIFMLVSLDTPTSAKARLSMLLSEQKG